MKLSSIKIDAKRVEEGTWVGKIPDMPGLRLKVRGFGNADDRRILDAAMEEIPRAERLRGIPAEHRERIMTERLVGAILVDWDGLEGDDGQPVPYSAEKARDLLTDPDMVMFRDAVLWATGVAVTESAAQTKVDAKN